MDQWEIDFVVTEDRQPILFVECKVTDRDIARGLRYPKTRFPTVDAGQIALSGRRYYRTPEGIRAMPAVEFLRTLA